MNNEKNAAAELTAVRECAFALFKQEKEAEKGLTPEQIAHDLDTEWAFISQASLNDLNTVYHVLFHKNQ